MKKRILAALMCLVVAAGCVCCGGSMNVSAARKAEQYRVYSTDYVHVWVDPQTGVNYFVRFGSRSGGITPRYNADGSLYVTDVQ